MTPNAVPESVYDRREARFQIPLARHASWAGGAFLIAIGLAFMLNNAGLWAFGRQGWALLLFLPAAGAATHAANLYRDAGYRATPGSIVAVSTAVVLSFIAVILLFDLSWALLWPMFLIIPGLAALLGASTHSVRS